MRELALHVLDILQNAVEAGATQVSLTIDEDLAADRLTITIRDNGCGMDAVTAVRATDPFFTTRTTRQVGLGLPLLAAATERANGRLTIQSEPGMGTTITATFQLSHPDLQPLGDIANTLLVFLSADQKTDLSYQHICRRTGDAPPTRFEFSTTDIRDALGDVAITHPVVREWLAGFLAEGEDYVKHQA